MVKIEGSVMIDRPVEEVWKFITDLSNMSKWYPAILEARPTSAGPIGVGSTIEIRRKNMTIPQRITEWEPNRKFTFVVTSGPAKGTTGTYSVENIDGKTRLTLSGDFNVNGIYKLVGPFITPSERREALASLSDAKRVLESEAKS
jgi:carbon monoxide dehydrogenase subunit G